VLRSSLNPILTRGDIPAIEPRLEDVSSVFNPGAVRLEDGRVGLVLRVQTRGRETVLMPAAGGDGRRFDVEPRLVEIAGLNRVRERLHHVYDPRLTAIEGRIVMIFAADVDDGCRLGVAVSDGDLGRFELVSFGDGDARNGVLFPRRVGGRYLRLERPNRRAASTGNPSSGDEIVLAASDDLQRWETVAPVLRGRPRLWDEFIGSGPPPIETAGGWLHVYHGVATHFASSNIYQAGVCLLELDDPSRVVARGRNNVLEPREPYELAGQVPNVVFPTGMVADGDRLRVYYGAADTVVATATTSVDALLEACRHS
jgi:beta-1,4-mannooligosaccharide/beta-1,4-mannosyl-N-acetylglucosamine phosphorylase